MRPSHMQASRFKYLPISTPSIAPGGLRRGGGTPRAFGGEFWRLIGA